ncbi:MAG: SpoIIIAH-like family protein [Methylocystaceae bacterium]
MVLNGRKLVIVLIVVIAVGLSLLALNRIITGQSSEIPSAAEIQASKSRVPAAGSYFAEHRMIRERNRSRQIELLEKIVNNERMDSQNKSRAARELIALTEISERERLAEETVKAIGYQDCVVLLRENAALAVVAAESLSKERERLLTNQLTEILNLQNDRITVMARPK